MPNSCSRRMHFSARAESFGRGRESVISVGLNQRHPLELHRSLLGAERRARRRVRERERGARTCSSSGSRGSRRLHDVSDPSVAGGASPAVALRAEASPSAIGETVALDGVTLEVRRGECVALIGESGSGKTTLLRCFNRLTDAGRRAGCWWTARTPPPLDPIELRRRTGYVPQDGGLLPHWRVRRNVALVPWLRGDGAGGRCGRARAAAGRPRARALRRALAAASSPAASGSGSPSRGRSRRSPSVVLLDEPFGALDAITRADLQTTFLELRRELALTARAGHPRSRTRPSCWPTASRCCAPAGWSRSAPPAELRAEPGDAVRARARSGAPGSRRMSPRRCSSCSRVQAAPASRPVVVASKPFGESYILAEMFAQLLEARGIAVDRRPGLGATEIAFRALRTGAIDVYPEYTGTGLLAILGEPPVADPRRGVRPGEPRVPPPVERALAAAARLREHLRDRGAARDRASGTRLATLSDLARVGPARSAPDSRRTSSAGPTGCRGSRRRTACGSRTVRALLPAVKYQALAAGEVDVIDGYSTDGLIARYDLVVLRGRPAVLSARTRPRRW